MRVLGALVATAALLLPGTPALAEEPSPTPSAEPATPMPIPDLPKVGPPFVAGDEGPGVLRLQQHLVELGYPIKKPELNRQVFGPSTEAAVKGFQRKFWLPANGIADARTVRVAGRMATKRLPSSCTDAPEAICIDKSTKLLRLVRGGKTVLTLDARFGTDKEPTSEGSFRVVRKSANHTSSLYETWMPFSLFYHGGEAIHYSSFFARDGYSGASHGCINLRDFEKSKWLFNQVDLGTPVIVYRS